MDTLIPDHYRERLHFVATRPDTLFWLNLVALPPLFLALLAMTWWHNTAINVRGAQPGGENLPFWLITLILIVLVLVLHEWVHGLAIQWAGHRPRYGIKTWNGLPLVLYATTDNVLFPRNTFIAIALAPLIVLTLLGMVLIWLLPDSFASTITLGVALNAAGAVGDLWMTALALRFPSSALVRDEADGIRIFAQE
jgi:hypothetical protein